MKFDLKRFGERIKELRIEKRLTTVQLAEALCVTDATISRWENGLLVPKADSIFNLAKYFGVPAGYILGLEN